MVDSSRPEYAGVDLAVARTLLAGAEVDSFDFDFLAIDTAGRIGVFLGDRDSQVPSRSGARATSGVLDELACMRRARAAATHGTPGYREADAPAVELVFDTPQSAPRTALHETPVEGYPQLIVAAPGGERAVRDLLTDYAGREVLSREGFAIAIEVLGPVSSEKIHATPACAGCRVLADPLDPHPRSPEALATMGLYVYAFAGRAWLRVVSPAAAADHDDLPDAQLVSASTAQKAIFFEETPWLSGDWFER